MKKISLFVLVLFLSLGSTGCSFKKFINKNTLGKLSVEELNKNLVGITRDKIIDKLGEPDGSCFGMYCDFYNLSDKDISISFYYDEDSKVYEVMKIDLSH